MNITTHPLAITLGDPAGIGCEVAAKFLNTLDHLEMPDRLTLVGSRWALEKGAQAAGLSLPEMQTVGHPDEQTAALAIVDLEQRPAKFQFGVVDAACGSLAVQAVERAAQLCMEGSVTGMVTCPINKEAIHAAGYVQDIGHQEILARLTKADWTATMLMTPGLRVVHLSTHKSLIQAAQFVTRGNLVEKLRLTHQTLAAWGLPNPRIAVAALNPHGGEGGLLGDEERQQIAPAVSEVRTEGVQATGPIPADSVFNRAIAGEFDVVLAMYHDQGHIAIKVHDFHHSTTATLGIPFIRTSVDHGTAFDIAGQGVADPTGLAAAVTAAQALINGQLGRL